MAKKTFGNNHEIGGVKFKYEKSPYLTVSIGSVSRRIKKTDLWMLVFMMSKGKTQDDLIPVWEKEMVQFVRQYKIIAKNDMKAGETIVFNANINIPKIVVESLLKKEGIEDPSTVMLPTPEVIPT